jgi:RecB family exonuclease
MAELVQDYVDHVKSLVQGDKLMVEQRVDFTPFVDEADSFGTADVVIVRSDEVQVIDLKTGRTPVEVESNTQMMTYALGVLHELARAPAVEEDLF